MTTEAPTVDVPVERRKKTTLLDNVLTVLIEAQADTWLAYKQIIEKRLAELECTSICPSDYHVAPLYVDELDVYATIQISSVFIGEDGELWAECEEVADDGFFKQQDTEIYPLTELFPCPSGAAILIQDLRDEGTADDE